MSADRSQVDAIVASLVAPSLRSKVEVALAYTRTVAEPRSPVHHGTERELWGAAVEEAGLGTKVMGSKPERPIPLASDLTPEQRKLVEVLACTPGPYLMYYAMPTAAWVRRQWIGIDPPGPLFRVTIDGVPLFHAVRTAMTKGNDVAAALLRDVPDDEWTAALCDLRLSELDAWSSPAEGLLKGELPDLGERGASFGTAFADRLLALFAEDQPAAERSNMKGIPVELARAAFVSLVRAGTVVKPEWDVLLPLAPWIGAEERTRNIGAVPEPRRNAALARAFQRGMFDTDRVRLALEMLPEFPYPSVAEIVVAHIDVTRDTENALALLREASAKNPAIAKVTKSLFAKLEARPKLRISKHIAPVTRADLDALRTKQFETAQAGYGGKRLTVARIFAEEEDEAGETIMPSLTEIVLLVDEKGAPAYDAWLYMGDSGSIFKAGTTKRIASIIQGGLECKPLPLRVALKDALAAAAKAKREAR
jgi:hypothetical protein